MDNVVYHLTRRNNINEIDVKICIEETQKRLFFWYLKIAFDFESVIKLNEGDGLFCAFHLIAGKKERFEFIIIQKWINKCL